MKLIDLKKYIGVHSPGYVIETYKDGKFDELVIGNRENVPVEYPTTSDTLYDIASLTKVYTAVLVYMAYEEEKINIYDTVYSIEPKFNNIVDVKIIDLLTHNQDIWTDGYLGNAKSKEEFYDILYTSFVKDKLPTYVDVHYIILATLLEKVYGIKYQQLIKEKILDKLNLQNTVFDTEGRCVASNNFEHKTDGSVVDFIYPGVIHDTKARVAKQFGIATGHASIFATGEDVIKFLYSFFDYSLLKKETIDIMLSHSDSNLFNYNFLKKLVSENDINLMYEEALKIKPTLKLITYNNMGTRYKNDIDVLNDLPVGVTENSIVFSGFTGPMFVIDFTRKIIVLVMCNVMHNTYLERMERKRLTVEI